MNKELNARTNADSSKTDELLPSANLAQNPLLAAVPIVSFHLEDKYGFECKVDYDKDFPTDKYYSLKIATYKKKIVGNLEIHITDSFKFVEAPDTYKYQHTTVEICQGTEYQEIKIDKMPHIINVD